MSSRLLIDCCGAPLSTVWTTFSSCIAEFIVDIPKLVPVCGRPCAALCDCVTRTQGDGITASITLSQRATSFTLVLRALHLEPSDAVEHTGKDDNCPHD